MTETTNDPPVAETHDQQNRGPVYRLRFLKNCAKRWDVDYWSLVERTLADLDPEERDIVRVRWLEKTRDFDLNWRQHRAVYYCFRVPIIIGAATVPVLAGLSASMYSTAIVGLVVAILTGLESLFQLGPRWQKQRLAATQLEVEGWRFVELAGGHYEKYQTHAAAYKPFLDQLEQLNASLSESYVATFREPAGKQG